MVSKRTPKNPQKYFLTVLEFKKIRKIRNNQEGTPGGHKTPGRAWQAPRWVVPTRGTFQTSFFYSLRVSQDKNLYIPPEPVDHRIAEKYFILFSCCFWSDLLRKASCLLPPPTMENKKQGCFRRI